MMMAIQASRQNAMTSQRATALGLRDLSGRTGKIRSVYVPLPASLAISSASVRSRRRAAGRGVGRQYESSAPFESPLINVRKTDFHATASDVFSPMKATNHTQTAAEPTR